MAENWVKVGTIGVDAGMVWIGDPCYVLHKKGKERPKDIGKDWGEFCNKMFEGDHHARSFSFDMGHEGLGVCVSSGLGDGSYDVMARIEDVPGWGRRVCEIRVVFVADDEPEEDDETEES